MNRVNTRKWSTPIVIGSGIFVTISGVLMFFGVHNPIQLAHEWVGMAFAVGIGLHILNHWPAFKSYFNQKRPLNIIGVVGIASFLLIGSSMTGTGGSPVEGMIQSYVSSPLTEVAPLLDQQTEGVMAKIKSAGFSVDDPNMSIKQIAAANNAHPKALMSALFN
jgi:hypothetical protein